MGQLFLVKAETEGKVLAPIGLSLVREGIIEFRIRRYMNLLHH